MKRNIYFLLILSCLGCHHKPPQHVYCNWDSSCVFFEHGVETNLKYSIPHIRMLIDSLKQEGWIIEVAPKKDSSDYFRKIIDSLEKRIDSIAIINIVNDLIISHSEIKHVDKIIIGGN